MKAYADTNFFTRFYLRRSESAAGADGLKAPAEQSP